MRTKRPTILPPLPATGKRRLRKLIAHLRAMPRKQFDFQHVVVKQPHCGTVCCAMGATCHLFPKTVRQKSKPYLDVNGGLAFDIQSKDGKDVGYINVAMRLFGVSYDTGSHLFGPNLQAGVHYSLPNCPSYSTPKQVAAMLEKFIKLTETEAK